MTLLFDLHANFSYSTVATAPSPASSGTSLTVQSGDGAKFPGVSFNAVVWPVGANPLTTNAEIVRVTNISSDTFTITRTQEGTSARSIVVGDQIGTAISKKTFTDIENEVLLFGGRLGLDSNYVPTSDLTAQLVLNWNPGGAGGDRLAVFDGTSIWKKFSSGQLTLKATDSSQTGGTITGTTITGLTSTAQLVPGMTLTNSTGTGTLAANTTISTIASATSITVNNAASVNGTLTNLTFKLAASTTYDVILVNDAGTLRLLWGPAWTNSTTRASAVTTQNGITVNSGSWTTGWTNGGATVATLTGVNLGTVYVGTTTGQLNDAAGGTVTQVGGKRWVWNRFNQVMRTLAVIDTTSTWSDATTNAFRIADGVASPSNCVEYVTGDASTTVQALLLAEATIASSNAHSARVAIGVNSGTTASGMHQQHYNASASSVFGPLNAYYSGQPGLGYNYIAWLECGGDGSVSFIGTNTGESAPNVQTGLTVNIIM